MRVDAGDRATVPLNSPCIGLCELDAHEVCRGCHRTVAEIAAWSELTPRLRDEVRARIARDHAQSDAEA